MRTREEIEKEVYDIREDEPTPYEEAVLELLFDIRELLTTPTT